MTLSPAPILASLKRRRLTSALLMLQVAFTVAVVANVAAMTAKRIEHLHPVTGLAERGLVVVESTSTRKSGFLEQTREDIASLHSVPGVLSVTAVDTLPLTNNIWQQGVRTAAMTDDDAAHHTVSVFTGFPGEVDTLGLHLVEGHGFASTDYVPMLVDKNYEGIRNAASIIVTRALANDLWPRQPALGQMLYVSGHSMRIVGVLDHLLSPVVQNAGRDDMAILLPAMPDGGRVSYIARTRADDADVTVGRIRQQLERLDPERVIVTAGTFAEVRARYFQADHTMIGLLLAAALGLLFVTALGIGGLASFWVQQRYRQIGIRRAIGATRAQIRVHFQLENALIVGGGAFIGCALALGLNVALMHFYEVEALPIAYLPATAVALWLLGQLAVYSPARRASHVSPVVAIRSA